MKNKMKIWNDFTKIPTVHLLWEPFFGSFTEMIFLIIAGSFLGIAISGGSESFATWQYLFFSMIIFAGLIFGLIGRLKGARELHRRVLSSYPQPSIKLLLINPNATKRSIMNGLAVPLSLIPILFLANLELLLPLYIGLVICTFMSRNYFAHTEKANNRAIDAHD